jgi:putative peptidoglycan binding protein
MSARVRGAVVAAALAMAACSHTSSVGQPSSNQVPPKDRPAKSEKKDQGQDQSKREIGTAATPVSSTPAAALEPGQLRRIQHALAGRKLLGDHQEGSLDDATKRALRRLQHDEDLPETGLPDHETVRKLGLDPDEVFAKRGSGGG